MPRSNVIYVVQLSDHVVAAFTVKHELVTWLERQSEPFIHAVWRVPDNRGDGRPITKLDVAELVG